MCVCFRSAGPRWFAAARRCKPQEIGDCLKRLNNEAILRDVNGSHAGLESDLLLLLATCCYPRSRVVTSVVSSQFCCAWGLWPVPAPVSGLWLPPCLFTDDFMVYLLIHVRRHWSGPWELCMARWLTVAWVGINEKLILFRTGSYNTSSVFICRRWNCSCVAYWHPGAILFLALTPRPHAGPPTFHHPIQQVPWPPPLVIRRPKLLCRAELCDACQPTLMSHCLVRSAGCRQRGDCALKSFSATSSYICAVHVWRSASAGVFSAHWTCAQKRINVALNTPLIRTSRWVGDVKIYIKEAGGEGVHWVRLAVVNALRT
jgi:hypothetical protein